MPAYVAGVWSLSAILRGPGAITLTATPEGSTHVFEADAATTAAWLPGRYSYSLRASFDGDVFEAGSGVMDVLPDLASVTTPYDGRSDNEKALAAIEAVIAGRATIDQSRYRLNNRELWRTPIAELLKLQAFYRVRVRRERMKSNGSAAFGRPIQVRFS